MFSLSLINALCFFAFFPKENLQDSWEYKNLAVNLINGNGFSVQDSPPYQPTIRRVPVYPVFIAIVYKIYGMGNDDAIFIFQIIFFAVLSLCVYYLGLLIKAPPITAGIAGIITALNPSLAGFTCEIMSEIVYALLMAFFAIYLIKAFSTLEYKYFIISGIFIGLNSLCRPTAQLLPIFLLIVFLIAKTIPGLRKIVTIQTKRLIYGMAALTVSCFVIVSPWLYHNHINFGKTVLTKQAGDVLFINTVLLSDANLFKANALASISERLARSYDEDFNRYDQWRTVQKKMRAAINDDPRASDFSKGWSADWFSGRKYLIAENIWMEKSLEFIKDNPLRYFISVLISPVSSHANLFVPQFTHSKNISNTSLFTILLLKIIMLILVVTVVLCLGKNFRNIFVLTLMIICLYNILSFIPLTSGSRHIIVNLPLYSLFCAITLTGAKLNPDFKS